VKKKLAAHPGRSSRELGHNARSQTQKKNRYAQSTNNKQQQKKKTPQGREAVPTYLRSNSPVKWRLT
jgi:hypothetical protein